MWKPGLPGNRHLAFFSLGFLLVFALLNLSSLEFYSRAQSPEAPTGNGKERHIQEDSEEGSVISTTTTSPQFFTLEELRDAAVKALRSCSACAPHRSTWLRGQTDNADLGLPNVLHVVRYGAAPMTFMEAVCIKAWLVHQKPNKFYLHSNIVDLTRYGEHWQQLYKEPALMLSERLRLMMARDPSELAILGKQHVSQASASLYWKLHVLSQYGGFVFEPKVFLLRPLNHLLQSRSFSALKFSRNESDLSAPTTTTDGIPQNGILNLGTLQVESAVLAATTSSPLLSNLLRLAFNSTEESFAKDLELEIEREGGSLVISDDDINERIAVNVEKEAGMKSEEVEKGESVLAGIIQAVWGFNTTSNLSVST